MRIKTAAKRAALILTLVGSGVVALSATDHASAAYGNPSDPPANTWESKGHDYRPAASFGIRWS